MRVTSAVPYKALYSEYVEMMRRLHELRGEYWMPPESISEEQFQCEP